MRGDYLNAAAVVAEIFRRSGRLPVAVVIDHEHIAAGFHVARKDLIGRHDKILIEARDGRQYLSPELARVSRAVALLIWKIRLRSRCNNNHVR
jgi:hypothetical protein